MKHFAYILSSSVEESSSWCNKGLLQTDKNMLLWPFSKLPNTLLIFEIWKFENLYCQYCPFRRFDQHIVSYISHLLGKQFCFLLLHICWLSVAGSCIEQQASEINISTGRSGVANKQTRTSPTKQTHPHPHHTLDKKQVIRKQEGLSCIIHSLIDRVAFSLFVDIFDDFGKYSESDANLNKDITMRRAGWAGNWKSWLT